MLLAISIARRTPRYVSYRTDRGRPCHLMSIDPICAATLQSYRSDGRHK